MAQQLVGPVGYYRNPDRLQEYKEKSVFLPSLNNEIGEVGFHDFDKHKSRLMGLNSMTLVMFDQDNVVNPRESQHFAHESGTNPKGERTLVPFRDTELFKKDSLGLSTMLKNNKLHLAHINNEHCRFTEEDIKNVFVPALRR